MIISLTGPSGAGKEFLKKALLHEFPTLTELCWTTTRMLRSGEIQGVTRESISRGEFNRLVQIGKLGFVQNVFNHSYGIRQQLLQNNAGYLLTEFHIDNLVSATTCGLCPLAIGLVPLEITFLEERLKRRGTESAEEVATRLETAKTEIRKIYQCRGLFSFFVEFTKEDEHTVVDRVCSFLQLKLKPKGIKPNET